MMLVKKTSRLGIIGFNELQMIKYCLELKVLNLDTALNMQYFLLNNLVGSDRCNQISISY